MGTLLESEFQTKCEAGTFPDLIDVIWANLAHYLADSDIRERDPEYRQMQDSEMDKLVRLLRAGAPDDELRRVHFLGYS